jgi:hypothetical protein
VPAIGFASPVLADILGIDYAPAMLHCASSIPLRRMAPPPVSAAHDGL